MNTTEALLRLTPAQASALLSMDSWKAYPYRHVRGQTRIRMFTLGLLECYDYQDTHPGDWMIMTRLGERCSGVLKHILEITK